MRKPKDLFIIEIEGPDKVGKHTQSLYLSTYLSTKKGTCAPVYEMPSKEYSFGHSIYEWLKGGLAMRYPEAFQTLQFANRFSFQEKFALESGAKTIIMDRWIGSTYAYGYASGLTRRFIDDIVTPLWKPDLTFILFGNSHVDPDEDDQYEKDDTFQDKARSGYIRWIEESPKNKFMLDANRPKEEVFSSIKNKYEEFINETN